MDKEEIIWSVSEVNGAVKDILENSLAPFYLQGEVSSLLIHRSGHVYLSLKDEKCQIRATYFSGARECTQMGLKNGDRIEAFGRLSVYDVRGEYQFAIRSIRQAGLGEMQRQFELVKRRLADEGLFDERRKRPIPVLPGRIGVITSPSGAAIRDFLQIVNRRFPNMQIRIYPCQVQGATAAREVAQGVEFFNRTRGADVLVVTRGGGSMEDLWPFNDEALARTIAASVIPVISAVGHEIDFTIADFVADLRVPTPSAAAELVVGSRFELERQLERLSKDLKSSLSLSQSEWEARLNRCATSFVFREPRHLLEMRQQQLDEITTRLGLLTRHREENWLHRLDLLQSRLASANPALALERGFVMLFDEESGELVTTSSQPSGRPLKAQFADGPLHLLVR